MSEINTRPSGPRGRGSNRGGGRGGFSTRGGRGGFHPTNGTKSEAANVSNLEDEEDGGDIRELKSKYAGKIGTVKEMFPDWSDQDVAFALDETNGDLETTVERISSGTISQWGEVKKKTKDRSQSKVKEPIVTPADSGAPGSRGGRGRGGLEAARGGRGRGTDRGRGASRGARGSSAATNGTRATAPAAAPPAESAWAAPVSEPTTGGWDSSAAGTDSTPLESSWENVTASEVAAPTTNEPSKPASKPSKPDGTRSWASMFAKPKPAPAPPKGSQAIPSHDAPIQSSIPATSINHGQGFAPPLVEQGLPPPLPLNETSEIPNTPPTSDLTSEVPTITPSGDELTETNLEQVPDTSGPTASATAASTVATTLDPRNAGTPLQPGQQNQPSGRPVLGGFATSAWKATGTTNQRTPSFQRKVLEQQEAVVMPGKHAVDRAAVQFGSMGLNGTPEDADLDSDREDAETRTQPPQHSPVAPRASLPPPPQHQGFPSQSQPIDSQPTPRQAPGLPPVNQSSTAQQQDQPLSAEPGLPSAPSGYPYNQFGDRYGTQSGPQGSTQKPYEPFGQQAQQSQQSDGFPSSSQPAQQQTQGPFSSAGNDMSSFYTSDNQRNAYQNNFYGNYGQQAHQQVQDSQQRAGSAFGSSAPQQSSQYATSQGQQPQGRFGQTGETQTSGNSTPSQQPPNQPHQMMSQQQGQGQGGGQYGGYPGYQQNPYGSGSYYSSYMNHMNHQYGYGGSQGGYGGGPFGGAGGKGGMYGAQAHQGYGVSPQTSYDQHSASPANAGAFGSQLPSTGRDSAATGGLGSYGGRSGSAQPGETPQQHSGSGAGSYSSAPDPFGGRSSSGYQGHNQGLGSGIGQGGNDDSARGYGDSSKVPGGPSPALGGRPGSAVTAQGQSGQGQGGYGGYPSHINQGGLHGQQGSQYGSGGPGGHQSGGQNHQGGGGYGAYGAGGYGGNYYGGNSGNRGGWGAGANYGH